MVFKISENKKTDVKMTDGAESINNTY